MEQQRTLSAAQQHRLDVLLARYQAIVATIPVAVPPALRAQYEAEAHRAVMLLGKARLARVHWSWMEAPMERVPRGRAARPAGRSTEKAF